MRKTTLPIRFGLIISAVLIAYFLILALFHKHINPVFSFFNAVITAFGIFETVRISKLENPEAFSYGEGFKTGIIAGFVATLVFTIFFLFYATEFNTDFLPELLATMKGGFDVDAGTITFIVFVMGLATTVIATLVTMQYFKNSKNISQNK